MVYSDFEGRLIRFTDERIEHVLEHPEMRSMMNLIPGVLGNPERVIESLSDPEARLYYRLCRGTRMGDKHLCVVVKATENPFVVTAYLTDAVKKGRQLWPIRK